MQAQMSALGVAYRDLTAIFFINERFLERRRIIAFRFHTEQVCGWRTFGKVAHIKINLVI
jgi:hypothetical protein